MTTTLVTTDGASIVSVIQESIDTQQIVEQVAKAGEEGPDVQQVIYIAYENQEEAGGRVVDGESSVSWDGYGLCKCVLSTEQ